MDVILVPLPVWIYLLLLPTLLFLSLHKRRTNFSPSTAHLRLHPRKSVARTIATIIYYLLIIANILMQILEIVRLCLIHFGVGLLPFAFVALLFVLASHLIASYRGALEPRLIVAANTLVWVGLMVMEIVKTVGLVYQEHKGVSRKGSKYPVSDQVIDCGVMAGVYLALALGEMGLAIWRERAGRGQILKREDSAEGPERVEMKNNGGNF